ncbi:AbrB/MazE/SpoVT family DNA-binding domain-containing protein [Propionivibrio sp.]|uniref:AbrB/MazE/SpoVT family DNA-binding domain-containing protein n=1 Tax=Propionivibrio sp. TaxID=2212460 RepID=UPI0025EEA03A|nr:AbrB/MazE/SpoVT family DNA-binding domain-containing protein [Propionivibrio sp.]MBK8401081.1 AbrB/MazE/SpoVT family DNA-binding domain-containing protein [Propionivibrio sp.]MBK8744248.1 AbrB/MazE/SpoVT family DNA-binding domain-containing protein [Propionivibrio sp.]MBK8894855.1 AbrB/MazE/SpoVT family DNA-binding domain-containing protein [Propionivibrio sp.]
MPTVTLSPKFQVVIPLQIRESLGLKPGQKVEAMQYLDRVEFIPVRSAREMRGFLKGIDTTVPREKDRV